MRTIHYSDNTPAAFRADIRWAMDQWEKVSGKVRFVQHSTIAELTIQHAEILDSTPGMIAAHKKTKTGSLITFETSVQWATTWAHRALTKRPSLRTFALHELGHFLGLPHSSAPSSIMFYMPSALSIDHHSAKSIS